MQSAKMREKVLLPQVLRLPPQKYPAGYVSGLYRKATEQSVFKTTLIAYSKFNPHPGHVVASLDKTLQNNYLCLVASNKQQIQWTSIQRNPREHWINGKYKQVRISPRTKLSHWNEKCADHPKLAYDAVL